MLLWPFCVENVYFSVQPVFKHIIEVHLICINLIKEHDNTKLFFLRLILKRLTRQHKKKWNNTEQKYKFCYSINHGITFRPSTIYVKDKNTQYVFFFSLPTYVTEKPFLSYVAWTITIFFRRFLYDYQYNECKAFLSSNSLLYIF